MPGIVGIISKKDSEESKNDLNIMVNSLMHETFYTSGKYVNCDLGLYAGWICHKDSFSDCMPIYNERKDLIMLFSGETFVDDEVIKNLTTNGHEFDPLNASYLIHLYEENRKMLYFQDGD